MLNAVDKDLNDDLQGEKRLMTDATRPAENAARRIFKVIVRTLHLVGMAGLFGQAMTGRFTSTYLILTIVSGVVLTLVDILSDRNWFVQLRGVALYLKLLCLLPIHFSPNAAIPCLIVVVVISGFMSHAPSWIRYYSLWHGRMILPDKA